jgi:membrane-bound ClpP family serine protease
MGRPDVAHSRGRPALAMVAVNIAIGLVVLLVLQASRWSTVLLFILGIVLVLIYRSYATFSSSTSASPSCTT